MFTQRFRWNALLCAGLVAASGCDGNATGPDGGGDGTGSDPLPAAAPALPVPASPFAEAPATSDTLTVLRPLTGIYRPLLARAFGDWVVERCSLALCIPEGEGEGWSDQLRPPYGRTPAGRLPLVVDGAPVQQPSAELRNEPRTVLYHRAHFTGEPLGTDVYIRRDRFWEWAPVGSSVREYLILTDGTEATIESTFTSGTATTETREFGQSVTFGGSLDIGPLELGASKTLSDAYSASVEVSKEVSETYSRTVRGTPGVQTRFMVWILVERYSFTDADGRPLTHPSYEFVPEVLYRRGVAEVLQATTFPLR